MLRTHSKKTGSVFLSFFVLLILTLVHFNIYT